MRIGTDALKSYYLGENRDYMPNGVFCVEVGQCRRKPQTPIKEAVIAAKSIYKKTSEPIVLCLSSGLDSQAMLQAFVLAKVPFTAATLVFENRYNAHDVDFIVKCCRGHGIPHQQVELDVISFFESGRYLDYCLPYRCNSPQLSTHLYLADQLSGAVVFSGNPISIEAGRNSKILFNVPGDLYFCYQRFFNLNKTNGEGLFFMSTPELIYSFWRVRSLQNILRKEAKSIQLKSEYELKIEVYREAGFNIVPQAEKTTGFEKVREYYQKLNPEQLCPFDMKFRLPLVKKIPLERQNFYKISHRHLIENT